MEDIYDIYERFVNNYRKNGGLYLYPQFDSDLKKILEFMASSHIKFEEIFERSVNGYSIWN